MAEHVCPWWIGYLLVNPLRKLWQHPQTILAPYVKNGMTVLDIGSGMGFFSIPMAHMVGSSGKVICVDLQQRMLASLEKKIKKSGLIERIETRICSRDSMGIEDLSQAVDFVLTFALVHEVPDQASLLQQIYGVLKPGGQLMIAEPVGHVSPDDFEQTIGIALQVGFEVSDEPTIKKSHTKVLQKNSE